MIDLTQYTPRGIPLVKRQVGRDFVDGFMAKHREHPESEPLRTIRSWRRTILDENDLLGVYLGSVLDTLSGMHLSQVGAVHEVIDCSVTPYMLLRAQAEKNIPPSTMPIVSEDTFRELDDIFPKDPDRIMESRDAFYLRLSTENPQLHEYARTTVAGYIQDRKWRDEASGLFVFTQLLLEKQAMKDLGIEEQFVLA